MHLQSGEFAEVSIVRLDYVYVLGSRGKQLCIALQQRRTGEHQVCIAYLGRHARSEHETIKCLLPPTEPKQCLTIFLLSKLLLQYCHQKLMLLMLSRIQLNDNLFLINYLL